MRVDNQEVNYLKKFAEFLDLNYKAEILDAARLNSRYISISFKKIIEYDFDLGDYILADFEVACGLIGMAASNVVGQDWNAPKVRMIDFNINSLHKDIWRLRSEEVNKFVILKGFIRRIAEVIHYIDFVRIQCNGCEEIYTVRMKEFYSDPTKGKKCPKCGQGLRIFHRELRDLQRLVVEEDPMYIKPPQKPRSIMIELHDDLCREDIDKTLQLSRTVVVSGIVKDKRVKPHSIECRKFIEANMINVVEENLLNMKLLDSEIKEFQEFSKTPDMLDVLAQSVVPNIQGHEQAKVAALLQLAGGVALYKDGLLEERGCIHVLLVGSPGQGKSVILKRSIMFMPGSIFTGGKLSSGVGLVASVSKDEELGGWVCDAGAVPRASGAICAIDEVDKISKEDIAHLNNAMVDMKVRVDKAGVHTTLETETSILAAANPVNRIFDRSEVIWKQIGLPKDFVDRFDLIFPIISGTNDAEQRKVADLVVGKYRHDSMIAKPIKPHLWVMKYLSYAKKFEPTITEEVHKCLVDNFVNIARPADKQEDSAYFSYRLLTNIIRLTQAVAKLRLRSECEIDDAGIAINLLLSSLKAQDIITKDGLMDYFRAEAIIPKKKRDIFKVIKTLIERVSKENLDNLADGMTLAEKAAEYEITPDELDEYLDQLKRKGDLFEPKPNKYKLL
jgi:DNA replicative helicase MCM subunit Mcm2 (Cdc46/Mcm family)